MVGNEGVGRLLGDEHVVFGEGDADVVGFEELDDLGTVFEVGAGRIAKE